MVLRHGDTEAKLAQFARFTEEVAVKTNLTHSELRDEAPAVSAALVLTSRLLEQFNGTDIALRTPASLHGARERVGRRLHRGFTEFAFTDGNVARGRT